MKLDFSKLEDITVADINIKDAPDFSDAHIESASIEGRDLTEEELEEVNKDHDFVYEQVMKRVYG